MKDKKLTIILAITAFVIGLIIGNSSATQDECKYEAEDVERLVQVDDAIMTATARGLQIAGDTVVAASLWDTGAINEGTAEIESLTDQISTLSNQRHELLLQMELE